MIKRRGQEKFHIRLKKKHRKWVVSKGSLYAASITISHSNFCITVNTTLGWGHLGSPDVLDINCLKPQPQWSTERGYGKCSLKQLEGLRLPICVMDITDDFMPTGQLDSSLEASVSPCTLLSFSSFMFI